MGHFDGKILPEPLPKYSSYRINILSIVEDGAIEEWGKKEYPAFLKQSIDFANEVSFAHRKSLTEMYEERVHPIDILYEAFTSYIIMARIRSFLPILRDMKLFIMSAARCWHAQSIWIQQRSAAG